MHVVSANRAAPQVIEYRGQTYRTGIFKTPTGESLQVTPDGISGDAVCDQKNHGGKHKAVYGFSMAHYPYWREALARPALDAGAFGENLTMNELCEETICIGDELRIGTALLQVSQPRVPCFKLGVALGNDRAPALFTRHLHTGVYFRVLEAGEIGVGDEAVITGRHAAAISVHDLFRACFDSDFSAAKNVLSVAASIAELAPEWQQKVKARAGGALRG